MNLIDYPRAFLQFLFCFLSDAVFDLTGLFMVAIAIPFRKPDYSKDDRRPIINLPKWAYIWGNDYDGLLGDKYGKWISETPFGVSIQSFLAMYWWAAIRNPADNMRMFALWQAPITGSTITYVGDSIVDDKPGRGGWQLVKLVSPTGRTYYGFYGVWQYSPDRAFICRFGFKISPDLSGTTGLPVGESSRVNPWKTIS